jgi:single-strand DNA-binding protein
MSSGINMVILVGNLGRDPETGSTESGRRYARLSLATSQQWRDKTTGEKREATQWHRIVAWGDGLAGMLAQYAKKGSKLYVQGKLSTRKWQGQDGQDRYTTEVVVQGGDTRIQLLGDASGAGGVPPPEEAPDGRYADDSGWDRGGEW